MSVLFVEIIAAQIRMVRKRPFLMLGGLLFYFAIFLYFIEKAETDDRASADAKFHATVAREISTVLGADSDVESLSEKVRIMFNAYDRKANGALGTYGLVNFLEDVYATQPDIIADTNKSSVLLALIAKQKEQDPYYGLRFEQKVIIRSLENRLTNGGGTDSLDYIEEIKEVVRRQNIEIDDLKQSNRLGLPIGVAGVIVTILFGIVGLLYPLLRRKSAQNV